MMLVRSAPYGWHLSRSECWPLPPEALSMQLIEECLPWWGKAATNEGLS